ncbi:hypothetical protein [Actinoplanes sp. NPDC049118]|uniref:hypothetical protein n=1 Tax=Actinoplanes sp. NPDC049118 TaxID=3155769 RepID=UPI0033EF6763
MNNLTNGHGPDKHDDNDRARVVIACLLTAGGFFSAAAPILVISGAWALDDGTVRYVITMGGAVLVIALLLAAVYVSAPLRREPAHPSCGCDGGEPPRRRRQSRSGRRPS